MEPNDVRRFCSECKAHKAMLDNHYSYINQLRHKDHEIDKEIGGMKKMIFGFLIALLLGVYGNLIIQWKTDSETVSTKKLAKEIALDIVSEQSSKIHPYNTGP